MWERSDLPGSRAVRGGRGGGGEERAAGSNGVGNVKLQMDRCRF